MSSSEGDSDSLTGSKATRHADLADGVFKSYVGENAEEGLRDGLAKVQSILTSSASGALSCLICLERIRTTDPTWSCSGLCYSIFHLICIQSWARQASALAADRVAARLPVSHAQALQSATWNCPKCRSPFPATVIPGRYLCFCGKVENPAADNPWIVPHSCGEVCGRPLRDRCGHLCLLLCHPGPCPPCPKLVSASCYCGKGTDVRRCGTKGFSCGSECGKPLSCGAHKCTKICHEGDCEDCGVRGVYRCQCGKEEAKIYCRDRNAFRCANSCKALLPCGRHRCENGCHPPGVCGECVLQGRKTCPCGKTNYDGMPCDAEIQLCGSTCDKLLSCGYHRCHERCHRGPCLETCRIMVMKKCRCGGLKKEVPCYQDISCERKCQRMRDCGNHVCKRRCCDGNCPSCTEICEKRLLCKNHKCPAPCHRGPCAPCPLMVTISCACGETHFEVPCGAEMDQKPPRCRKKCDIQPLCIHASDSKPHKCHYGPCPPCRFTCDADYSCGHKCKLICHGPRPPPKPDFTLKPKKKKQKNQSECYPGSPCPPCPELVWTQCVGQHLGAERMMVCSSITKFSCNNLCGNPLACGNHYCTKACHSLESKSSESVLQDSDAEPCEECRLPCNKDRNPCCQHSCPLLCHPGECPPCTLLVKRSCHCGAMVHAFQCSYFINLTDEQQIAARSCGGPCHRKLPNCTHLCPETCHPGPCPSPEKCCKKVTVRCPCQSLKKEWLCRDVQAAYRTGGTHPNHTSKTQFGAGLLQCNSDCIAKTNTPVPELHQRKSSDTVELTNLAEKQAPKRRRRAPRSEESKSRISPAQISVAWVKRIVMVVVIAIGALAMAYFGYNGLLRLSDYMNHIEQQQRLPRYRRF